MNHKRLRQSVNVGAIKLKFIAALCALSLWGEAGVHLVTQPMKLSI